MSLSTADGPTDRISGLDGLRGLAVLAVIAFHAELPWARGGFLGVDLFFVLSGFVITRSLLVEHDLRGRIDLVAFWGRRAARLLPALLVLVIGVTVAVYLRDGMLGSHRPDAVAALLYSANWRFLAAGDDYFRIAGAPSLLQHTWSLSVEEQLYVVWPLLLLVALWLRRPRRAVVLVAAIGAAVSAVSGIALSVAGASPERLHYGTDVRAQALLAGAVVAGLLHDRRLADSRRAVLLAEVVGIAALIATGALWWRAAGGSPILQRGGTTGVAILGALTVASIALSAGGGLKRALSLAPLRGLGRVSYGVYLWHWPIQLLVTGAGTGLRGPALIGLRLILTVGIAAASYHIVELPVRRFLRRPGVVLVVMSGATAGLAGVLLFMVAPLTSPATPPDSTLESQEISSEPGPQAPVKNVTSALAPALGATTTAPPATAPPVTRRPTTTTAAPLRPTYRVAVLGDSVGQSLAQGLQRVGRQYGLQVFDDAILGCGVAASGSYRLAGVEYELATECEGWEKVWADRLERDRPAVTLVQLGRHEVLDRQLDGRWTNILDSAYAGYVTDQVNRGLDVAASTGSAVIVLTAPYFRTGEKADGSQRPENDPARVRRLNDILRRVVGEHPGVTLIDLGSHTNPSGRYTDSVDGIRMRRDGVHYSAEACAWFAPWLVPPVRSLAARR